MNRLASQLAEVCRLHRTAEKWLLAPALRVGGQWLEAAARGGQPILNVNVKTLKGLAMNLAAPTIGKSSVTLVQRRGAALLVDKILSRLRAAGQLAYLGEFPPSAGLAETIQGVIQTLRLANLAADEIAPDRFESPAKGEDLRRVLEAYESELRAHQWLDDAELLRLACERLRAEPTLLPRGMLLLVPDSETQHTVLARRLLELFPVECRLALAVDERPHWIAAPAEDATSVDLPSTRADADCQPRIVRAVGEMNEVRHVLRECLARQIPLDQVELLHTDAETYVPLVFEALQAVDLPDDQAADDPPATFADGIPCRYSRPGRALLLWLEWVQDGYAQATLVRLLREGLFNVAPDDERGTWRQKLARVLRGLAIGHGRERYLLKIDEKLTQLRQQPGPSDDAAWEAFELDSDEQGGTLVRRARREDQLQELTLLRDLLTRLLDLLPTTTPDRRQVLVAARSVLEHVVHKATRLDNFAAEKLLDEIADLDTWLTRTGDEADLNVWKWLADMVRSARVLGSGPRAGCLHVAPLLSGGHAGRPYQFVVGLDDARFPGAGLQDPLLLDAERERLSSHVPRAALRLEEKRREFFRLLARLRGQVSLSFCSRSLADDRERFPSSVLLEVFRQIANQPNGDQQALLDWLPAPICFAPADEQACLDASEWWYWRVTGAQTVPDAPKLVQECYPHLARGARARLERQSDRFTPFDGLVPLAGQHLDPTRQEQIVSASQLELVGRCPRAYLFKYGLGLEPPRDVGADPERWLDALAMGSFLHELLERFMAERIQEGRAPTFDRDWPRLAELFSRQLRSYQNLFPAPSASVLARQVAELRQTAETFLREEEAYAQEQSAIPVWIETSLGMARGECGSELDCEQPIPLDLPGVDRRVRLRGRIDRIDRLGAVSGQPAVATYAIWDYKSGSSWKYKQDDPFWQGRVVQPYLYVTMVQHRLRHVKGLGGEVDRFGFFFPGVKAAGERIAWSAAELSQGLATVDALCRTIAQGAFLATNNHVADCAFCDFRPICDDVAEVSASSRIKLAAGDHALDAIRALRPAGEDAADQATDGNDG